MISNETVISACADGLAGHVRQYVGEAEQMPSELRVAVLEGIRDRARMIAETADAELWRIAADGAALPRLDDERPS